MWHSSRRLSAWKKLPRSRWSGQDIAARNFYRPVDARVRARYARQFPEIALFTVDDTFGGWAKAQKTHFADGGVFDTVYTPK